MMLMCFSIGSVPVAQAHRSFAIENEIRSNFWYLMLYSIVVCSVLLLPLKVPFWAYIPLMGGVGYVYKTQAGRVESIKKRAHHARYTKKLEW